MKKNSIYGLMIAVAMFMSGAVWALPVDTVVGMATSPDYENDTVTKLCTKVTDNTVVSMACRRTSTQVAYYQNNTKYTKTVSACGFVSEYDDVPTKIPILI